MMGPGQPVVPVQQPGYIGNTVHPTGAPMTQTELERCRCRPGDVPRPPLPAVGDLVGYRAVAGGPVVAARVQGVESLADPWAHEHDAFEPHGPDVNVWDVSVMPGTRMPRFDPARPGAYLFELRDDPWPSVVVAVEPVDGKGRRLYAITREARLPGAAGWIPLDQMEG